MFIFIKTFLLLKVYVLYGECRKLNLLSFGEEAEEEEKELAEVKLKIKSSHDVLDDPRLLKQERVWCHMYLDVYFPLFRIIILK